MTPGQRTFGTATLTVRESELVAKHLRKGLREITDIYTPAESRGKGDARRLLLSVCGEADCAGITLLLAVVQEGDVSIDDLCGWYTRNGFKYLQVEPVVLMFRPPLVAQRAQGII